MPRQDVPYGGAICRLRERIAEIWDELGKKLHSINGVEGDGQGNVLIRSDNAALTVTDDQVQHEIVLDLDTSQLPAADVNSVNGQTGVVALTADDIPSDNGDVQTDLDNLAAADGTLQGNINAEALARQNADNTLQTNINSITASLPSTVASAVAADPTVTQLATDVPNKLDKITSGSSLKAYTHTGATQGETSVVDGTTANSIGVRDANGRMQAADPASGATDKTLVTANWISQTGDSGPNNLLHKTGNETANGRKTFPTEVIFSGLYNNKSSANISNSSTWMKLYETNTANLSNQMLCLLATPQKPGQNTDEYGILIIGGAPAQPYAKWMLKGSGIIVGNFVVVGTSDNLLQLWVKNYSGNRGISLMKLNETNWGSLTNYWNVTSVVNANFDYTTYPYYKVSE